MAKGAKSRPAAEAKRATKTSSLAKKPGIEAAAARAKTARGKTAVESVVKRKTAETASTPRPSPIAAAAKPAAKPTKSKASAAEANASKPGPARSPAAKPAKPVAAKRGKTAPVVEAAARSNGAAPAKRPPSPRAKPKKRPPPYLAAELGQPVDHEGEPIGAGSRAALADTELQHYTLQLWRQMQSRRGVNLHVPAMERAGVTIDQIWTAGVTDTLTTSSSPDDVRRYKQKLLFRANLLEAILTETVGELHRLNTVEPAPARPAGEPG